MASMSATYLWWRSESCGDVSKLQAWALADNFQTRYRTSSEQIARELAGDLLGMSAICKPMLQLGLTPRSPQHTS